MKNPLWFRAKKYGWGWTPATWQAWLILLIYIGIIMISFFMIDNATHSVSDTIFSWIGIIFGCTLLLIGICYLTGEKPKWQWGKK